MIGLIERGKTLQDQGVNAVCMGSGSLTTERVALLKRQGAKVFAEVNTMHLAGCLKARDEYVDVFSITPFA